MLICVATRRHAYCSSTNQCLQILTPGKKKLPDLRLVAFQARVINDGGGGGGGGGGGDGGGGGGSGGGVVMINYYVTNTSIPK